MLTETKTMKKAIILSAAILGSGTIIPQFIETEGGYLLAQSIAAGGYHSLAMCSNGTVKSWGWNVYG